MSQLFRKEAMEHRSRALFGEVVLRGPLHGGVIALLLIATAALIIGLLFGVDVDGQTVWSWMRG